MEMKCSFVDGGIVCGIGVGTPEELEWKKMVEEMDKKIILNPRGERPIDKAIKGLADTIDFDRSSYFLEMAIHEINELLRENAALKNRVRDLKEEKVKSGFILKGAGDFPSRLKKLMELRSITSRELSDMCGFTEVSMSHYLRGDRQPKAVHLHNMAKALGVTEAYLLVGE